MFSVLQLIAQTPTPTPSPGASAQSLPDDWGWVLALIAGGALVVLLLLFWFYKKVQDSTFVEKLLGLPTTQWPPRRRSLRRTQAAPLTPKTTPRSRATPGAFRFADEFLARRAEFWLLYAQAFVATFFIAALAALMLVGVVDVEAGLPALSTVVGIVLGKTLLSTKGTPLSAQEQPRSAEGPTNSKPPTISPPSDAETAVGVELTADPGEWTGQLPITYAYSWRRKSTAGVSEIEGETGPAYTPVDNDQGCAIAVVVTASNPDGTSTAISEFLAIPEA